MRPWQTLEGIDTPDGRLELRRRGESEFLIAIGGRVLMNSAASRSESELARMALGMLGDRPSPRVLIGGLGMGVTLRAALDSLPKRSSVVVAELHDVVLRWCQGPLSQLTGAAVSDPRVSVVLGDVAEEIAAGRAEFDAILLDLYEGPHPGSQRRGHPHYGPRALAQTHRALAPDGILAVWSEDPDRDFESRLRKAGFTVERQRPGRGGRRHVVYVARPKPA